MRRAIDMARQGELAGEVPVGAVLVDAGGTILAETCNAPIRLHDPTAHAEILALRRAADKLETYRLEGSTLGADVRMRQYDDLRHGASGQRVDAAAGERAGGTAVHPQRGKVAGHAVERFVGRLE